MEKGLLFIRLLFKRTVNRLLINLYQKPETFFLLILLILFVLFFAALAPFLADFHIPMEMGLFPEASYIFLIGGLFPYIFFVTKEKPKEEAEGSLLHYITEDYWRPVKNFFSFFLPFLLSILILFIVLSIYDNIPLFDSLLFWQALTQVYFIIAVSGERAVRRLLRRFRIAKNRLLMKYGLFFGIVVCELSVPLHQWYGRLWLDRRVPAWQSVLVMLIAFVLFLLLHAKDRETEQPWAENARRVYWLKRLPSGYGFLALIHMKDYLIFLASTVFFMAAVSKIAGNFYSISEIYLIFLILGGTAFTFSHLAKTAPGIALLRLSHLNHAGTLLALYFASGAIFFIFYLWLISLFHGQSFAFLCKSLGIGNSLVTYLFGLYIAVLIYYWFHQFFGPALQMIASFFVLVTSYRIWPEYVGRVMELGSVSGRAAVFLLTALVLYGMLILTIGGSQDDTNVH